MPLELDHIFVFLPPGGKEAALLAESGLKESSRRTHKGQGTSNACFAFENSYLELIWVSDTMEVQTELVRPLGLWDRSRWRETNASPFGIGLRSSASENKSLPFKTFPYNPPYLPPGVSIQIAENNPPLSKPLTFIVPTAKQLASPPQTQKVSIEHPLGCRQITAVRIHMLGEKPPSEEVKALSNLGVVLESNSISHHLDLEFDHGAQGGARNFSPSIPVALSW